MTRPMMHYHKSNLSQFIRERCRDSSTGLVVCDVDYIFRDYRRKKVMIVEEKTNSDFIPNGEKETLRLIADGLRHNTLGFDYHGSFVVRVGSVIESDPIHLAMITNRNLLDFKQVSIETLIGFLGFDISFEEIDCLQTTQ